MRTVGPFEPKPHVAVGVSGGPDSLALVLQTARWARARSGVATALIVDHGLRQGSLTEARRVAHWLGAHRIGHHILRWRGPKPKTGVQAAAREARYSLMTNWCRRHDVLHLLVGHQRDDQAETFMMRLARGSGTDGLACMPPVVELPWVRLVRPLLDVPRNRLLADLETLGQPWIEDPTNRDPAYMRVRVRHAMTVLDNIDLTADRLAGAAKRLASVRGALERKTAHVLSRAVTIHATGFCRVDRAALTEESSDIGMRALSRILMCIGGQPYPPRSERLERLYTAISTGALTRMRTLGGCLVVPRREGLLVTREPGAVSHRMTLAHGSDVVWDHRFRVIGRGRRAQVGSQLTLAALGRDGWAEIRSADSARPFAAIPAPIRYTLPAMWDHTGLVAVPHFGYRRAGTDPPGGIALSVGFWPRQALAGAEFSVV